MVWIIAFFVLSVALIYWLWKMEMPRGTQQIDFDLGRAVAGLCGLLALLLICGFGCKTTTGFYRGVSEGTRDGYLTKLSTKGFIFKTHEGEMQVGSGEMAALQSPWAFSIDDPEVLKVAAGALGKRVRMKYVEWYIPPWTRFGTEYEIVGIEVLN